MEQRFELTKDQKKKVKQKLIATLKRHKEISFAYLHGSFWTLPFRDIDIGAYCLIPENDVFDFELEMSAELETVSGYPADLKVLNYAPIGFQFSVINEGTVLFEKPLSQAFHEAGTRDERRTRRRKKELGRDKLM